MGVDGPTGNGNRSWNTNRSYERDFRNDTNRTQDPNRPNGTQPNDPANDRRFQTQNNGLSADGFERTLAEGSFEHGVTAANVNGSVGTEGSAFYGQGSVDFGSASVSGSGDVTADLSNLNVSANGEVDASAWAVNAQGSLASEYGIGSTRANGYAQVGATANASGNVTFDPLHGNVSASAGGEAFAGARAGVDVTQTVGPVGATAGVEGFAGIGVEFEADAGFQDGVLSANFDVGAALGIGGSLEFGVSLDVGGAVDAVSDFAGDAAGAVSDFASGAADAIGDAFSGW